MLTVDMYARIRQAHRDGMSIRAIARTFHHSRRKVRDALASPELNAYLRACCLKDRPRCSGVLPPSIMPRSFASGTCRPSSRRCGNVWKPAMAP